MNRHVAKLAVFWLFCIVFGGYSHACEPLDIEIHYGLLYAQVGTYNIYNGPEVISGWPVMEIEEGEYAWQWGCDSGLNWAFDYADGSVYAVKEIGAATPGVYAEYAVGCNESGSYDTDVAYVVVLPAGCDAAGPHDSSMHFIEDCDHTCNDLADWGQFEADKATYDMRFAYSDGVWVCEIRNVVAVVKDKIHPQNYQYHQNVFAASDVPCFDVDVAIQELTDMTPNDDDGAPWDYYWSFAATVAHEHRHMSDWESFYSTRLARAVAAAEAISVSSSEAPTCQDAAELYGDEVGELFDAAWVLGNADFDDPATPDFDEANQRAYQSENIVVGQVLSFLPEGCTP